MNFAARPPVVLVEMDTGLARTPVDGGFVELPSGRPALSHRPPPPRPARPSPPAPPSEVPGRATAAGWSFLDAPPVCPAPTAAGFVVELIVDTAGFRIDGRPARPAAVAAHLTAVCPPGRTPLLLPSGVVTSAPAMTLLIGSLTDALGRPVVLADPAAFFTVTGIALGGFRRFHPRPGRSARRIDTLGPALPARPGGPPPAPSPVTLPSPVRDEHRLAARPRPLVPVAPPTAPAPPPSPVAVPSPESAAAPAPEATTAPPEPAADPPPEPGAEQAAEPTITPAPIDGNVTALLAPGRPTRAFAVLAPPPPAATPATEPAALSRPVSAPPASAAPDDAARDDEAPATPALWLPEAAPADADRNAVRQALNGRYDAHARIVARRLSEDPGLRAVSGSAAGITAGLVAVRAYLLEERDTVNRVLRGHVENPAEREHAGVLARTATYGLHRLPSVFGPVFHAASAESAVVSGYRPGDELVEPAFLDVDVMPSAPDEETSVEIAIWSVSARRVGGLDVGDATALFPPGSRFAVLAVDRSEQAPPRVLLRDLSAIRRGGDDLDRILSRLRDAPRRGRATGGRPRSRYAPGLDEDGRRYRRQARQEGGSA